MVESCRVELRAEATGLQPAYPVPGLKLSMEEGGGIEPLSYPYGTTVFKTAWGANPSTFHVSGSSRT